MPFDEIAEVLQSSLKKEDLNFYDIDKASDYGKVHGLKSQTTAATKTQLISPSKATKISIVGIVCLVLTVVTGALAIPLQLHLPLNSSFLKLSWR